MKFESLEQYKFASMTYRVIGPEGTIFVNIIQDDTGKPIAIDVTIGKAGSVINAWARSVSRLMTVLLEKGGTLENIIEELSSQSSDHSRRNGDGIRIHSGPEGIVHALMQYRREKHTRDRITMGIGDDESVERKRRSPRVAR